LIALQVPVSIWIGMHLSCDRTQFFNSLLARMVKEFMASPNPGLA